MTSKEKKFTGRKALIWILTFFATVAAVNGVMVWVALRAGGGS